MPLFLIFAEDKYITLFNSISEQIGRKPLHSEKIKMWYPFGITHLYTKVLLDDILQNGVKESDVRFGVRHMAHAYKPCPNSLLSSERRSANFNVKAHRCAYLHKNAAFHTALVYAMMNRAIAQNREVYQRLTVHLNMLKICSLGGGPGCDLIGVLSALHHQFGFFHSNATLVDIMSGWEDTFTSIIHELRIGDFGTLGQSMQMKYFNWSFVTADLLEGIDRKARESIECADMITMIKFVSATACLGTASMIEEIFDCMKPGALVFFIDNASGGFRELVNAAAIKCKFNSVFGPLKYEKYVDKAFDVTRFGYVSCHSTTVTVQILIKSYFVNIESLKHHPGGHNLTSIPVKKKSKPIKSKTLKQHTNSLTLRSPKPSDLKIKQVPKNPFKKYRPHSTVVHSVQPKSHTSEKYTLSQVSNERATGSKNQMSANQISSNPVNKYCGPEIKKTHRSILKDPVKQKRIVPSVIQNKYLQTLDSRPANQLPGLLSGNHQVGQYHAKAEKNQITEQNFKENSSPEAKKVEHTVTDDKCNVSISKFLSYSWEKQQKLLKVVNLQSSSQSFKLPRNSPSLNVTERKDTVNSPVCASSLRFYEYGPNAENLNQRRFPYTREKLASDKPISACNDHLKDHIQSPRNRVETTVPKNVLTQSQFNSSEHVYKPSLKSVRSQCNYRTFPSQSSHNSTGSILRNSSSIAVGPNIPPSNVKAKLSDDRGCSCCVIL